MSVSTEATRPQRIVLTGFSGSGKSAVAHLVAERLGWEFVDTDSLVEQAAGWPVAGIFARAGERSRRLLADGGFVVCLEARPETVLQRLREGEAEERPLLAAPDPLSRIRELKAARQPVYALADHTVHTDGLTLQQVAARGVRAWEEHSEAPVAAPRRAG